MNDQNANEPLDFFLPPNSAGAPDLSTPPDTLELARAAGEPVALDPLTVRVRVTEERPEVDRLSSDWGAICEVYKENRYFYAEVSGVQLAAGDVLTLCYPARTVILKVTEIEKGRARIDPPVTVSAHDDLFSEQP